MHGTGWHVLGKEGPKRARARDAKPREREREANRKGGQTVHGLGNGGGEQVDKQHWDGLVVMFKARPMVDHMLVVTFKARAKAVGVDTPARVSNTKALVDTLDFR